MYDNFWAKESKFLDMSYNIPVFDSANFILNALDYLTDNDDLINLRGKTAKRRPLYRVDNMRKKNLYRYKLKENDIFRAIDAAKQGLIEVAAKKTFEDRDTFSSDELAVIGNIRNEINSLRQELSSLKLNANRDIEALDTKVKFFNIYFIALTIIFMVILYSFYRRKFHLCAVKNLFYFDKSLCKLAFIVSIIVACALLCVYLENKNSISEYEDRPVFQNFDKRINDISLIKLQNQNTTLTFEKKNGIWVLQEHPSLPVYQERIRRFLITVNNMTFYEKKSDKVADMQYFGFSPLKNKKSPMISVVLSDTNNQEIESFDIGWYDMDLGRGSKSAFIRLKNKFQIWLVEADFYDLSLDIKNWTYSSLWNLRFGRLISYNDISTDNSVMNLAKILLNTYYQNIVEDVKVEKLSSLHIKAEYNNLLDIVFYKSSDGKYFIQYVFLTQPNGKHIEFFDKYVRGKFLQISKETWEEIENAIKSR